MAESCDTRPDMIAIIYRDAASKPFGATYTFYQIRDIIQKKAGCLIPDTQIIDVLEHLDDMEKYATHKEVFYKLSKEKWNELRPDYEAPKEEYYYPELDELCEKIADWREQKKFDTGPDNIPEKIALAHSELSEALEDHRCDNMAISYSDDKSKEYVEGMPKPIGFPCELADVIVRVMDIAGSLDISLSEAMLAVMKYNETRPPKHGKNY